MKRYFVTTLLVLVLAVTACAAGRDFVRPPTESLILGKTTYKEIFLKFGKPRTEGTGIVQGQSVKTVSYGYSAWTGEQWKVEGVMAVRQIAFAFVDDVLVSHVFSSSFSVDQTDFDESKVKEIKTGETTREAVIELLGPPHGLRMYPLVDNPGHKALSYIYQQVRTRGMRWAPRKRYKKTIVVTVDSNDIVTDVKFAESGEGYARIKGAAAATSGIDQRAGLAAPPAAPINFERDRPEIIKAIREYYDGPGENYDQPISSYGGTMGTLKTLTKLRLVGDQIEVEAEYKWVANVSGVWDSDSDHVGKFVLKKQGGTYTVVKMWSENFGWK